jgi:hypothetical protein
MSDAIPKAPRRVARRRDHGNAHGVAGGDEVLASWGAYLWGLSTIRDSLSHELRSPMNPLVLNCGLLGEQASHPRMEADHLRAEVRRRSDVMLRELERLKFVAERMVERYRVTPDQAPAFRFDQMLAWVGAMLEPFARMTRREFVMPAAEPGRMVRGEAVTCRQALFVLLLLALQDLPEHGRLELTLDRQSGVALLGVHQVRQDGGSPAAWFPVGEASPGPPGVLRAALRALESQGVQWTAPVSPGEPIVLRWHLEDTES